MGWECYSPPNPTMAAFVLHGLTCSGLCPSSCLAYTSRPSHRAGSPRRCVSVAARVDNSPDDPQQQLNISVLRFTLGIPGLDESYLPRYLGLAFGSLIMLNHFFGSSDSPTPAQVRSEALGLCLAGFSTALPYIGRFLKGASPVDRSLTLEGNTQIFAMSEGLTDLDKEDLAWGSYVLLRNTNTVSVLIFVEDALCIRGYWNLPEDSSKAQVIDLFCKQIQQSGLADLKDALYFPQDTQILGMLPVGALSVFLQPIYGAYDGSGEVVGQVRGFILVASSSTYAYRDSDRAWISTVAQKFQGLSPCTD